MNGGFGMINSSTVIEGIRCRQFGKMFDEHYNHPLKMLLLKENKAYISKQCLNDYADSVARKAQAAISKNFFEVIKRMSNVQLASDVLILQQLSCIEIVNLVKDRWRDSREVVELVHVLNCNNLGEIVNICHQQRRIYARCKKIFKSNFGRILRLMIQENIRATPGITNKIRIKNGTYKNIELVTSKEFRCILGNDPQVVSSRFDQGLDGHTIGEYFKQINRLPNTRHKNTLLRVWNGDCLSYSRLYHLGIVDTTACPNCGENDTPEHMLFECTNSKRVWQILIEKIPKPPLRSLQQYAIGINDTKTYLMIKAEILKYIMHQRNLDPEVKVRKSHAYLKAVNQNNQILANL
jgi:hypothetical protein